MHPTRILSLVLLVAFASLTGYAVFEHGYLGFFLLVLANSATVTVFVDLTIALLLVLGWMWRDAHRRGVSPLPYVALTLGLGSVGPLLYLAVHGGSDRA